MRPHHAFVHDCDNDRGVAFALVPCLGTVHVGSRFGIKHGILIATIDVVPLLVQPRVIERGIPGLQAVYCHPGGRAHRKRFSHLTALQFVRILYLRQFAYLRKFFYRLAYIHVLIKLDHIPQIQS